MSVNAYVTGFGNTIDQAGHPRAGPCDGYSVTSSDLDLDTYGDLPEWEVLYQSVFFPLGSLFCFLRSVLLCDTFPLSL